MSRTVQEPAPTTDHSFDIFVDSTLAQTLSPAASIVVWLLTPNGELVSDSIQITVNGAFANQVRSTTLIG